MDLTTHTPDAAAWTASSLARDPSWDVVREPRAIVEALETGPGVVRVRGLLPDDTDDAMGEAFAAWAAELGTPVSQDADGRRLLPVRDAGYAPDDPRFRGPHSRRALSFHTDRCDVIGFGCVRPAHRGGDTELVSSVALYRRLRDTHPDVLEILRQPLPLKRHAVDPANPRPWVEVPVFSACEGHFAASHLRVLVDRADADPDLPSLTDAQRHALDVLDETARSPDLVARFRLERGDALLVNNWTVMHRRTAFTDPSGAPGRWLWRVWLATPTSRPLDPAFRAHMGAVEAGAVRGGIRPA